MFEEKAQLLRIYLAERDQIDGIPLHEWVILKASEMGIAGATAIKGFSGFCAHSPISSPALMSTSVNLPIVIEIVEQPEAIERFAAAIEEVVPEGLMTVENVSIKFISKRRHQR
jgi:uncharacterized protein